VERVQIFGGKTLLGKIVKNNEKPVSVITLAGFVLTSPLITWGKYGYNYDNSIDSYLNYRERKKEKK
jgi:hypothetical protein